ncbi:hypothetical protein CNMCM7691_008851 [Aspergillus felis]|uniref:Uncharacterized protein n=1 Tax=Aspergillus felis TaxID=1287682 RepID=A0A8H6R5G0_9EURO|nr:hypothetical protein CNMCM7691_008851 [Aspergillus felis]
MLPFPVPRSRMLGCLRRSSSLSGFLDVDVAGRVLHGASGKLSSVRKRRTFSGALCSENHDVPGSSSSSTDSDSDSEESTSASAVGVGRAFGRCLLERWVRVRA